MDILPLDKRKNYVGVLKNGIQSDRYPFVFVARILLIGSEREKIRCYYVKCSGAGDEFSPQCCQKKTASVRVWIAPVCDSFLQREAVWQL